MSVKFCRLGCYVLDLTGAEVKGSGKGCTIFNSTSRIVDNKDIEFLKKEKVFRILEEGDVEIKIPVSVVTNSDSESRDVSKKGRFYSFPDKEESRRECLISYLKFETGEGKNITFITRDFLKKLRFPKNEREMQMIAAKNEIELLKGKNRVPVFTLRRDSRKKSTKSSQYNDDDGYRFEDCFFNRNFPGNEVEHGVRTECRFLTKIEVEDEVFLFDSHVDGFTLHNEKLVPVELKCSSNNDKAGKFQAFLCGGILVVGEDVSRKRVSSKGFLEENGFEQECGYDERGGIRFNLKKSGSRLFKEDKIEKVKKGLDEIKSSEFGEKMGWKSVDVERNCGEFQCIRVSFVNEEKIYKIWENKRYHKFDEVEKSFKKFEPLFVQIARKIKELREGDIEEVSFTIDTKNNSILEE